MQYVAYHIVHAPVLDPTMRRGIVHGTKVVHFLEVPFSLLALEADVDELLRRHGPNVCRNALHPREERVFQIFVQRWKRGLWLIGQLPSHDNRILDVQFTSDSVLTRHHCLDVVFVPLFSLVVGIDQVCKVGELVVWRGIDTLGSVASPSCIRRFTLWRRSEIPGRLCGQQHPR